MSRARERPDTELNLSAMIDILSIMLFFLMATVSFLTLKTLNAAVPAASTGAVSTKDGVTVSVEIRAEGYIITATGTPEDATAGKLAVNLQLPMRNPESATETGPQHDTTLLSNELWKIKKIAPEVRNIMINPAPNTPFHTIISTMDAAREKRSELDPNRAIPLFTRPVLTELEE